MIKEANQICRKLNKMLGITVTLPNPNSKMLKTAMACNFSVGVGLVAAGVVFSSRWCAALGGLSIVSSALLRKENDCKISDR